MSIAHPTSPRATLSRRVAILVAIAFTTTAVASLAHPSTILAWDENAFSSGAEHDLVALTNRSRAAAGRKALKISSTLTSIARWRSKDMITRDYFSHSIPGYGKVFKRMSAAGFCYDLAGENIGWNNDDAATATPRIHQMFMDSSGHRANILGKDWDVIGVGAYQGADGKKMYTVLFADTCGSKSGAGTKPKPKPKPKPRPAPADTKPRATPKPKPKPAQGPTPEPTPTLVVPQAMERVEPTTDAVPQEPTPRSEPTPAVPPPAPSTEHGRGLRVIGAAAPPGLLDAIVGGVTSLFLGT